MRRDCGAQDYEMKTFFKIGLLLTSLVGASRAAPQARVLSIGEDFSAGSAAFSRDGRFLAALTFNSISERESRTTFRLFNAQNGKPLAAWRLRTLQTFAIAPDGRTIATITADRQRPDIAPYAVEIRDLRTGALRRSLVKAGAVNAAFYCLSWSPDGKLVAASSGESRVIVWNAQSGRKVAAFGLAESVYALAWSPQRKLLALSGERRVQLWDWAKGQRVSVGGASNGVGASLQFSPDGKYLLARNRGFLLLEVPTLARLAKSRGSMPTFSHDGARIAFFLGSDFGTDLIVTDAAMKRQIFRFRLSDREVKALDLTSNHQLRWVSVRGGGGNERESLRLWQTRVR